MKREGNFSWSLGSRLHMAERSYCRHGEILLIHKFQEATFHHRSLTNLQDPMPMLEDGILFYHVPFPISWGVFFLSNFFFWDSPLLQEKNASFFCPVARAPIQKPPLSRAAYPNLLSIWIYLVWWPSFQHHRKTGTLALNKFSICVFHPDVFENPTNKGCSCLTMKPKQVAFSHTWP